MNKWSLLLRQIKFGNDKHEYDISNSASYLRTVELEYLNEFEQKNGITLPQEYKIFCQVFGTGAFGCSGFCIYTPDLEENIKCVRTEMIDSYHDMYTNQRYDISDEARHTIENSYRFGVGQGYIEFIFDLKSYNDLDLSYDIYVLYCSANGSSRYLGRDFFVFVRDYCLGKRAELEFPGFFYSHDEDSEDPTSQPGIFFPETLELEFTEED
jgi:hypothetical protein